MISRKTSFVGRYTGTADDLYKQFILLNPGYADREKVKRLSELYIQYGKEFNLRADLAWAQMEHETGLLTYRGDVKPEQNNFAGIGATGGVPGNSFASEELGVIAQYAHLAWYYYPNHINGWCSKDFDPRHFGKNHYKYNCDVSMGRLVGAWAVGGGYAYSSRISYYANKIGKIIIADTSKYELILQMGHVGRTRGATGTAG